ncbi:hypothetical protein BsWGS_00580 [Bradybaena similaris]
MTITPHHLHISMVIAVTTVFAFLLSVARGEQDLEVSPHLRKNPFLPAFLATPTNVTFSRGEEAILQCAIENRGTRTVVWRRSSDPNPLTIGEDTYVNDRRFKVLHRKHSLEWNLHIQNVHPDDSGIYECQVSARRRNIRQNIMLNVEDTPDYKTFKPDISIHGTIFVEKGDTLRLVCNATGSEYPPESIDWFKDGDKIKNNERITLANDVSLSERTIVSTLSIRRCHMGDAGTYVCRTSDLQVTSVKVNILNTGTNNEKRESVEVTSTARPGNAGLSSRADSPLVLLTGMLLTIAHLTQISSL